MLGIRSINLHLLSHLYGALWKLADELEPITNQAALIRMRQGEKEITDEMARRIEEKLALPGNWMDRDNHELIRMSALDYRISKKVLTLTEKEKCGLDAFIS